MDTEYPPLVTREELDAAYPGALAGVTDAALAAVQDDIRRAAGWHIAPKIIETIKIRSEGGQAIVLPTLKAGNVLNVERWDGVSQWLPVGWDPVGGFDTRSNTMHRSGGWPKGMLRIELEHGYNTLPAALLEGIKYLLDDAPSSRLVASESLPGHAVTFVQDRTAQKTYGLFSSMGSLTSFKLGPRP